MPTPRSGSDRLDAFFTTAPAGLAILDRELRYTQINETLALMNGRPVADHLGKSVREVLPTIAATLEPLLRRILDTGEPALNIELSGETPAQPGVTRYWRASLFPLAGTPRRRKATGTGEPVASAPSWWKTPRAATPSGPCAAPAPTTAPSSTRRPTASIARARRSVLEGQSALVTMLGYETEAQVLALELDRDVYVDPGERARIILKASGLDRITGTEVQWKRQDGHRIIVRLSAAS